MTQKQIDKVVSHYKQALAEGRITAKEFDGFIEAIIRNILHGAGR